MSTRKTYIIINKKKVLYEETFIDKEEKKQSECNCGCNTKKRDSSIVLGNVCPSCYIAG